MKLLNIDAKNSKRLARLIENRVSESTKMVLITSWMIKSWGKCLAITFYCVFVVTLPPLWFRDGVYCRLFPFFLCLFPPLILLLPPLLPLLLTLPSLSLTLVIDRRAAVVLSSGTQCHDVTGRQPKRRRLPVRVLSEDTNGWSHQPHYYHHRHHYHRRHRCWRTPWRLQPCCLGKNSMLD